MIKLNMILAKSKNNVIGVNNTLPWHLPEDLKMFKETTSNSVIIMGRKTYESIGRPLPNRCNIVITSKKDSINPKDISAKGEYEKGKAISVTTIEEAITKSKDAIKIGGYNSNVWITGGAEIYQSFLEKNLVDSIKLTEVDIIVEDDNATYCSFDLKNFEQENSEQFQSKNGLNYKISIFNFNK